MMPGAGATGPARLLRREWLACLGVGLAVMAPELVRGTSYSASFTYNVVWPDAFVAAMRAGDFYPRWLEASWDGLGAPTFYFYPPLFFFVAGLIGWIGDGAIPVPAATSLASALFIAVSGITMRLWLSLHVPAGAARLGALLWMLAPYRIIDIYARGALAEATVYATLPLVLWGLARIGQASWRHVAAVAGGYALMLLGHLPVTLLASLTIIPGWAAVCLWGAARGRMARLGIALGGGVVAIGLAAFFLVPALTLMRHVSADQLFTPFFSPRYWLFLAGPNSVLAGSLDDGQFAAFALALSYGLFGAAGLSVLWRSPAGRFWCLLPLLYLLLMSGVFPGFWDLPLVRQVQFPSRLLVLSEFAAVTVAMLALGRVRPAVLALPILPLVLGTAVAGRMAAERIWMAGSRGAADRAIVLAQRREAPEYLPAGYPVALDEKGRANPSLTPLPGGPEARVAGGVAAISGYRRTAGGGAVLSVASPAGAIIDIRRFWFPGWKARSETAGGTSAIRAPGGLVRLTVPPGSHVIAIGRRAAPLEREAAWLSILTAIAGIAAGLYFLFRERRLTAF